MELGRGKNMCRMPAGLMCMAAAGPRRAAPLFLPPSSDAAPDCFLAAQGPEGQVIGYVCGTRCSGTELTHESMAEHDGEGRTLCIHSVSVGAEWQRRGISTRWVVGHARRPAPQRGALRSMHCRPCRQGASACHRCSAAQAATRRLSPLYCLHSKCATGCCAHTSRLWGGEIPPWSASCSSARRTWCACCRGLAVRARRRAGVGWIPSARKQQAAIPPQNSSTCSQPPAGPALQKGWLRDGGPLLGGARQGCMV